jgi:hypothetical protein
VTISYVIRSKIVAAVLAGLVLAGAAGAAPTALVPARTLTRPAAIELLSLTGRSIAYVVGETRAECAHVELWQPATSRVSRFGKPTPLPCKERPSTGSGVWELGLARTRALWTTYVGGNFRDWQLWTATPTKTTPRRLLFVSRDVDAPPPVVVGPGTESGVPYAVDRQVVYLGENGKAIFKATAPSPVRALAAGPGPGRLEVAAVLANGWVIGLDGTGNEYTAEPYPPGAVSSVRVFGLGTAIQVGNEVEILPPRSHDGVIVKLPPGSTMLDAAQGRILYARANDLWVTTIATGTSARLVDGGPARPVRGQLEPRGIAWAKGRTSFWSPGPLAR